MNKLNGSSSVSLYVKKYDYLMIFLLAFLYIRWKLLWSGSGVGVTVFAALFCGGTWLRIKAGAADIAQHQKAAKPWLLVVAASAVQPLFFADTPVSWFNFLFLSLCAMYWMMTLAGRRIGDETYILADLFCQMVRVPFGNFGRFFGAVFRTKGYRAAVAGMEGEAASTKAEHPQAGEARNGTDEAAAEAAAKDTTEARSDGRKTLLRNLCLIGLALMMVWPVFLIVVNLLASADEGFMRMAAGMIDGFANFLDGVFNGDLTIRLIDLTGQMILAVPVAAYLFGALWADLRPQKARGWTTKESVDKTVGAMHFAPVVMVYTALSLFIVVYLMFLGLQAAHLLSALDVGIPQSTTYSKFAREGFFELCAVAAINLGIMAGAWLFAARREGQMAKPLRMMMTALSLETVFLVVTAMTKMGLYIGAYGLTRLRVYTFWFMIWLLLVFVILAVGQVLARRDRAVSERIGGESKDGRFEVLRGMSAAKLLTVLSVTMFLILGCANVDGIIVKENLSRYEAGEMSLRELNVYELMMMSDNAALEILEYYEEHSTGTDGIAGQAGGHGDVDMTEKTLRSRRAALLEEMEWIGPAVRENRQYRHPMPWYRISVNNFRAERALERLFHAEYTGNSHSG